MNHLRDNITTISAWEEYMFPYLFLRKVYKTTKLKLLHESKTNRHLSSLMLLNLIECQNYYDRFPFLMSWHMIYLFSWAFATSNYYHESVDDTLTAWPSSLSVNLPDTQDCLPWVFGPSRLNSLVIGIPCLNLLLLWLHFDPLSYWNEREELLLSIPCSLKIRLERSRSSNTSSWLKPLKTKHVVLIL